VFKNTSDEGSGCLVARVATCRQTNEEMSPHVGVTCIQLGQDKRGILTQVRAHVHTTYTHTHLQHLAPPR
jgi:hypothetical protein